MAVAGPSSVSEGLSIPTTCSECFLTYGEFCQTYGANTEKLIHWCQRHAILLSEKKCPNCDNLCRLDLAKKAWRCDKNYRDSGKRKRRCNFYVSIFKGSWFDHSHLDVESNLKFVYLFLQDWFSYKCAAFEIKICDKTINDWCSFCREVIVNWVFRHTKKIGGQGFTVEIDESKFGKRKYNVGRVIEGQWVFGGICRETREFFFVPVQERNSETLLRVIQDHIEPGTTIISDCWKAYNCLNSEGYKHLTVNHSVNFVDPITGAHTNTIERRWRDTKNLVPKYGRRKAHFVGYLAVAYFKLVVTDMSKRLHVFAQATAELYPPTP